MAVARAALLVAGVASKATDRSIDNTHINPELDPKSHRVFYNVDYPDDLSPKPVHEFDHPFPLVQDSEDYDKDFVKDENSDKGEWKLQQKYEKLSQRLAQSRAAVAKSKKAEEDRYRKLTGHRSQERNARLETRDARAAREAAEKRAEKKLKEAEKRLEKMLGKDVAEGGIAKATDKLKNETDDLEGCKKKLAEAREELKKLQEEKLRMEAAAKDSASAHRTAEQAELGKEKEEASWEKTVANGESDYNRAHRTYKQEVADLATMEADMKKAEEKIRHFRRAEDSSGGVYNANVEKSSARESPRTIALATAVMAAVAASAAQFLLA